uniref:Uncharacterized protein n=1 Tax=Oryza brachyantha TaxID=4533 RepID=J3LAQ4_ORYBR
MTALSADWRFLHMFNPWMYLDTAPLKDPPAFSRATNFSMIWEEIILSMQGFVPTTAMSTRSCTVSSFVFTDLRSSKFTNFSIVPACRNLCKTSDPPFAKIIWWRASYAESWRSLMLHCIMSISS